MKDLLAFAGCKAEENPHLRRKDRGKEGHPVLVRGASTLRRLLAVAVVVDVAGALQRNGVRRPGVALLGLGLTNSRLRDFAGVDGGSAAHWIGHRN